jgi:hypothetical protein
VTHASAAALALPATAFDEHREESLRWVMSAFQSAQNRRIAVGEQLRAVLQGRSTRGGVPTENISDVDATLVDIGSGRGVERMPVLGALYARAVSDEQELLAILRRAVHVHPVWPWLDNVRGIGELLAARLLSLLDIERAGHPASFWAFCGLSTVAAAERRCRRCGTVIRVVVGANTLPEHRAPDGSRCAADGSDAISSVPVRIAQPPRAGSMVSPYSREAKRACYLAGVSFTRQGTTYRRLYETYRERLDQTHPDWPPKRRYMGALRMTEKRFLLHLWVVWRSTTGRSQPGREFSETLAEALDMADAPRSTKAV